MEVGGYLILGPFSRDYGSITAYTYLYSGVPEDIKPQPELPVGTFGLVFGESSESETSVAEDVKPSVERDPWMESKPKAETDPEFGIKADWWMKTEELVKKEMRMDWVLPTDIKFIDQEMKTESDFVEEKVDLLDSMTKLEAIDPGLYKIISADMLRLNAQNYMLEQELAFKEKELAQKDDVIARKGDLIATKDKLIDDLQQQVHTLQPENEVPKLQVICNSREEVENCKGSLNSQLDILTTVPAMNVGTSSSDSEEHKLMQGLLEQFLEGIQLHMLLTFWECAKMW